MSAPLKHFLSLRLPALLLLVPVYLSVAGCGSKSARRAGHEQAAAAAEHAPPTPDTTPIETLRTPAGLVLKLAETPPPVTPAPSPAAPSEPPKPAS